MDESRKITFYSDAAHNYMVLECPPGLKENYQYKMLAANRIRGLLACSGRTIDCREYLYYDISSRQSLTDLFERRPVRGSDLNRILEDLVHVEETLTEYLLDTSHLLMDPACIYMDFREQTCSFVYYPGEEEEGGPEKLFSFLADRIDGRDKQAAALIYRLCMMAEKPGFRLRTRILTELGMQIDKEAAREAAAYAQDYRTGYETGPVEYGAAEQREATRIPEYPMPGDPLSEDAGSGTSPEGKRRGTGILSWLLAAVFAAAGAVLLLMDRFLDMGERDFLLTRAFGAILIAGGAILLIVQLVRRRKGENEPENETQAAPLYIEPEPWETSVLSGMTEGREHGCGKWKRPDREAEAGVFSVPASSGKAGEAYRMPASPGKAGEAYRMPASSGKAGEAYRMPASPGKEGGYRMPAAPGETSVLGPDVRPAAGLYGTGNCRGEQISLAELPCVVGKMQEYVDQVLVDGSVSRMHARFSLDREGNMTVRDLNSTNGTWLNGERLQPNESRKLRQGDHLRFGRMEFVFR